MKRWLAAALQQIHEAAASGQVEFTLKAQDEIENLGLWLDLEFAAEILKELAEHEFVERVRSKKAGEWLYVFKPEVFEVVLYVKIAVRFQCVVISFHRDRDGQEDEN
jgi:hypothetical protein